MSVAGQVAGPLGRYSSDVGIEVLSAVGRWDGFASLMVPGKPGGGGCVHGLPQLQPRHAWPDRAHARTV